jgi:hypothetical protein
MKSLKVLACATVAMACTAGAMAESLPAGVEGTWRITRQLPKKGVISTACPGAPVRGDQALKGTKVELGESRVVWAGATVENPSPSVHEVDAADFMQQYMHGGVTLKDLGLAGTQRIEVIRFGAGGTLPFDAVVVRDPSTIYFVRCGQFTEAVHAGGFVAPPLPQPQ